MNRTNTYDIRPIPHEMQRYETCGDYWDEGVLTEVRISTLGDARMEFCVMIHELIEEFLCKQRGISEVDQIKPFDEDFERNRKPGDISEPGHDPLAPYHKEHVFAEKIEMQIAEEIGLDWAEYTDRVNAL